MSKVGIYCILPCAAALFYTTWDLTNSAKPEQRRDESSNLARGKPNSCVGASFGKSCVPNGTPSKLAEYLACSSRAETSPLSRPDVIDCMRAYLTVKLSFVAGVETDTFFQLPLEERGDINRRAYQSYLRWRRNYRISALPQEQNPLGN